MGQLGNRVQHALRAFTPRDRKTVRAAAETFRPNPAFDATTVITELGVGEALVSTLQANGTPSIVQNTKIRPPESRLGPAKAGERKAILAESTLSDTYDETVDRKSAFEVLERRAAAAQEEVSRPRAKRKYRESDAGAAKRPPRRRQRQTVMEAMTKSVVRAVGSQLGRGIGRQLVRGLLGSLFKGR